MGYNLDEDRHLIINEHEAEAVKIIFQMFADGYGYMAIINYLN
ncbi:MAG: recombinase family protein [Ruminococcus sp.]|nr:recombinase family protein [Ruminococcus sp.]